MSKSMRILQLISFLSLKCIDNHIRCLKHDSVVKMINNFGTWGSWVLFTKLFGFLLSQGRIFASSFDFSLAITAPSVQQKALIKV